MLIPSYHTKLRVQKNWGEKNFGVKKKGKKIGVKKKLGVKKNWGKKIGVYKKNWGWKKVWGEKKIEVKKNGGNQKCPHKK